jgi:hypothetical protein
MAHAGLDVATAAAAALAIKAKRLRMFFPPTWFLESSLIGQGA